MKNRRKKLKEEQSAINIVVICKVLFISCLEIKFFSVFFSGMFDVIECNGYPFNILCNPNLV